MILLDVPGARLAYQILGRGPLLLMIPGANGTAGAFQAVTEELAKHYAVLTYDRRGFSRSRLTGPQDYDRRLETDADDVRRLIECVSAAPAIVFGSSSGAIVGLALLTQHPSVVRSLVPFEPPAVTLLPDGQEWIDFFFRVYDRYRQSGIEPALAMFRERAFAESDREIMARPRDPKHREAQRANVIYWFEHELRQYPAAALDFDALRAHADRIVPAVGWDSRGYPCYEATVALGKQLGRDVRDLPGGHVGFVAEPAAFARSLHDSLP
jgi:pimeloyl-ACP methyl ester carboxylesterase